MVMELVFFSKKRRIHAFLWSWNWSSFLKKKTHSCLFMVMELVFFSKKKDTFLPFYGHGTGLLF
jgi:hypothetical protein